jgi:hypothetical protein
MAKKKTRTDYKRAFTAANYDRIELTVPKGQKATVQTAADQAGESVNKYTQGALLQRMGLEDWPELEEEPHQESAVYEPPDINFDISDLNLDVFDVPDTAFEIPDIDFELPDIELPDTTDIDLNVPDISDLDIPDTTGI